MKVYSRIVVLALLAAMVVDVLTITSTNKSQAAQTPASHKHGYYGINWHPMWLDPPDLDKDLNLMQEAGVQSARIDAQWYFMERQKGIYQSRYLSRFDYAIAGMRARNIEPLIVVTGAPTWASGSSVMTAPPLDFNDYNSFLVFLIKRYSGQVSQYEIWNEPTGGWAWTNPDPVRYTQLLKSAYTAAKNADESVTILGGSISNTDKGDFLQRMYQAGAKDYFDVLSAHFYGDGDSHGWRTPEQIFKDFNANIVSQMAKAGDGDKPIWITETGYNTAVNVGSTPAAQADYLTRQYTQMQSHVPTAARLYTFILRDEIKNAATMPNDIEQNYGIVYGDFTPKPAYYAFQKLTTGKVTSEATPKATPAASAPTTPGSADLPGVSVNKMISGQASLGTYWKSDARAAGQRTFVMAHDATVTMPLAVSKAGELKVRAASTYCDGPATFAITVDGTVKAQVTPTTDYGYFSLGTISAGNYQIAFTMKDDLWKSASCDRNLYIDTVSVTG